MASTRSADPVSCFSTMFLTTRPTYNRAASNLVAGWLRCGLLWYDGTDAFGPLRLTPTIRSLHAVFARDGHCRVDRAGDVAGGGRRRQGNSSRLRRRATLGAA